MSNVTTMPVAQAASGTVKSISQRTRELHGKFRQLKFVGAGMTGEDVDQVIHELRAITSQAEAQEKRSAGARALPVNPGVCPAYELLAKAELTLSEVRRELVDRLQFPLADPQATLQARLADATAQIMRSQDHIRENTGELAS